MEKEEAVAQVSSVAPRVPPHLIQLSADGVDERHLHAGNLVSLLSVHQILRAEAERN